MVLPDWTWSMTGKERQLHKSWKSSWQLRKGIQLIKYPTPSVTRVPWRHQGLSLSMLAIYRRLNNHTTTTTILRPFFWNHPGEPVPEENFWTLPCKGRLTEADTPTIRLGATPSGLSSVHLHHPPVFTGRMPFLPPNQQCQSTEGN